MVHGKLLDAMLNPELVGIDTSGEARIRLRGRLGSVVVEGSLVRHQDGLHIVSPSAVKHVSSGYHAPGLSYCLRFGVRARAVI